VHIKKESINNKVAKLKIARSEAHNIKDKYSTNYREWCKACDKVNRINRSLGIMIRKYNFNKIAGPTIMEV